MYRSLTLPRRNLLAQILELESTSDLQAHIPLSESLMNELSVASSEMLSTSLLDTRVEVDSQPIASTSRLQLEDTAPHNGGSTFPVRKRVEDPPEGSPSRSNKRTRLSGSPASEPDDSPYLMRDPSVGLLPTSTEGSLPALDTLNNLLLHPTPCKESGEPINVMLNTDSHAAGTGLTLSSPNSERTNYPPEEPPPEMAPSPLLPEAPHTEGASHPSCDIKERTPDSDSGLSSSSSQSGQTTSRHSNLAHNPYAMYLPNAPLGNPTAHPHFFFAPPGIYPPYPFQIPIPRGPPEQPRQLGKPKRLKAHVVTSKSHSIPIVPRDPSGKPILPLNVGIMTVISLGEVCMREHFHTERYIFPIGYEVTRLVASILF